MGRRYVLWWALSQVCQGWGALPVSRLDRRASRLTALLGHRDDDEAVQVMRRQPKGSRLVVSETDAGTLVVEVPGIQRFTADYAGQAAFAVVWLSIVASWTASAAVASAPIFALFSAPFWVAGVKMTKDLLPTSTRLSIGTFAWEMTTSSVAGDRIESGATADLDAARIDVDSYYNDQPITTLRLVEGVNEFVVPGLAPVEQRWLRDQINHHLLRLRETTPDDDDDDPRVDGRRPRGMLTVDDDDDDDGRRWRS